MHNTDFTCEYGKCYKRGASKRSDLIVPQSIFSLLLSSVLMKHRYCLCWRLERNWETGCSGEMEIRLRICMGPCAGPSYRGPCHRHHMKLFKLISPGRSSAAPFSEAPTQTLIDTHPVHYHDFYPFSFPWHDKKFNYKNLHFTAISLDKQMFFINAIFLKANVCHLFHQDIPQLDTHSPKTESVKSCLLRSLMKNYSFDDAVFATHSLINPLQMISLWP